MDTLLEMIENVPSIEFIESFLEKNPLELAASRRFYSIINEFANNKPPNIEWINDTYVMISAIKDHLWEVINTGHFSNVNKMHRQLITLVSLQKCLLLLIQTHLELHDADDALEKCAWELDNGLLLGCPLNHPVYCNILNNCLTILQSAKGNPMPSTSTELNEKNDTRPANEMCSIELLERPSIQYFKENHFNVIRPAILTDCMGQWPAMAKWNQSDYLLQVCHNRVVPIEIGQNYTKDTWSQDLVKFESFFRRQFLNGGGANNVEYLAQHNLFDQIPELHKDICTPEYCYGMNETTDADIDVDIKAWLGPKGTISPMHIDEKHNLLCQVFGSKRIILAAPEDSHNLYPFDGDMLKNTSQIDAEHLDFERFPLLRNVKFYSFTLYKGEILYIPPKWWHYVRSLSNSFSVSFWWQ